MACLSCCRKASWLEAGAGWHSLPCALQQAVTLAAAATIASIAFSTLSSLLQGSSQEACFPSHQASTVIWQTAAAGHRAGMRCICLRCCTLKLLLHATGMRRHHYKGQLVLVTRPSKSPAADMLCAGCNLVSETWLSVIDVRINSMACITNETS